MTLPSMLGRLLLSAVLLTVLLSCSTPAGPGLSLGEAPWQDGEKVVFNVVDKNGATVGSEEIGYSKADSAWLLTIADKFPTLEQTMKVRLDAATLKPLGEEKTIKAQGTDATVTTTYQGSKLDIKAVVNGETKSASIDVPSDALDNDQILVTLRALKFADGYEGRYVNVVSANAAKINTTIRVQGKETVVVPAGSFEAWKLELDFGQAKQYAWYQVASPNQMVQYDNGATRMVLTK